MARIVAQRRHEVRDAAADLRRPVRVVRNGDELA